MAGLRIDKHLLFAGLLWLAAGFAQAGELVVVVNADSQVETLSRQEVINLFMGRAARLPSGVTALPVDLDSGKEQFYRRLADRTLAEVNAYWARLVFSGRGSPPRQVQDIDDMLEIVANNRGAIGYLPAARIDERVKTVLVLAH